MQRIVEVRFKDGDTCSIVSESGNAAWMCKCGRIDPLIGRCGGAQNRSGDGHLTCPDCERCYRVSRAMHEKKEVLRIVEVG